MDYNGILSDLLAQLINNTREYFEIYRREDINYRLKLKILSQKSNKILSLFIPIRSTKEKIIKIKHNSSVLDICGDFNDKLNIKLDQIDNILVKAKAEVFKGTNLNNLTSEENNKPFITSKINLKSLINFTLRVSSNFQAPNDYKSDYTPVHFKFPFPDDFVIKKSLLYMDEKSRLKKPNIKPCPDNIYINKGTLLELSYPDNTNKKGVFYKYTMGQDRIPTFFNGEKKYDPNNKPEIIDNMIIKVCSCKEGYMDSPIVTIKYNVTLDNINNNNNIKNEIYISNIEDGNAQRPSVHFSNDLYKLVSISPMDDDSSSLITTSNPGSIYQQISFHRKDSFSKDKEEDEF